MGDEDPVIIILNVFEKWALSRVVRYQVCTFMPRDPLVPLIALVLQTSHLFNQLIVSTHVVPSASEVRHHDHIIMLQWTRIVTSIWSHDDSHARATQSGLRIT